MKDDLDEDSLPDVAKSDEDTLKLQKIIGNSKIEVKDLPDCSAVFDVSMVSAAFEFYKYQKSGKNPPLNVSSSSSNVWDNSYYLIKETDSTHLLDPTDDLEKTLSDLQMDSDLLSEWPRFNEDFLNLYNFFDEQIESPSNQSNLEETTTSEIEVSNHAVVDFEMGDLDSNEYPKSLGDDFLPETDNDSFLTRSDVSNQESQSSEIELPNAAVVNSEIYNSDSKCLGNDLPEDFLIETDAECFLTISAVSLQEDKTSEIELPDAAFVNSELNDSDPKDYSLNVCNSSLEDFLPETDPESFLLRSAVSPQGSKTDEIEVSNLAVVSSEMNDSDSKEYSKELGCNLPEAFLPETDTERSSISFTGNKISEIEVSKPPVVNSEMGNLDSKEYSKKLSNNLPEAFLSVTNTERCANSFTENTISENEVSNPVYVSSEMDNSDLKKCSKSLDRDSSKSFLPETDTECFLTRSDVSVESKTSGIEGPNPAPVNSEMGNSDSKEYSKSSSNDSSEEFLPETDTESFQTRSAVSKSSLPSSPENTGRQRPVLRRFLADDYFTELDYEPSDVGETEAKECNNGFSNDNSYAQEECESFSEYCSYSEISEDSNFEEKVEEIASNNKFVSDNSYAQNNGSFSEYCSYAVVSENSTFDEKVEETDTPEKSGKTYTPPNFAVFFENNFELESSQSGLQANNNQYLEYDDDESESDSEHSFRRYLSRNKRVNDLGNLQPPVINPDVSKVRHLNSINEVMLYICEQCKCGNIEEATAVANRYIGISVESVQLEIFKELFTNVLDSVKSSFFPAGRISKGLGGVLKIFHESKLINPHLCSMIVKECFSCDHAIESGKEFLSFIQKMKVPVDSQAISTYVNKLRPSEIHSMELVSFMEYVKQVCNLPCPITFLCEALRRFSQLDEGNLRVGFFRFCKFLCSVGSKEVDINRLKDFVQFCMKNNIWAQIANFFRAWCNTDGHLIGCLSRSFLFQEEDVGMFYEKFAEEVYKQGDVSFYHVGILGQIGVTLMLEASSRKRYDSAFDVLFALHRHNINYFELQASLYRAPTCLRSAPNFTDLFVFPFTVAFAALDICLHLERFRDAYRVFKSYSLNLPADMDPKLRLEVRSQRFRYLLKLSQELFKREPLKLGLQAFHDICSAAEDFSLEELGEFTAEVQVIYNKYLTYIVNGCQLHTALELFECSESMMKEVFVIHPQVLRGLLVTFSQNDKMDEAYKFFSLGCTKKIYNIPQAEAEELVWCLTVMSSWTIFEVEFVIKSFIKNICLAWDARLRTDSNRQPSVKIDVKESEEGIIEVNCLKKSHSIDCAKESICHVLLYLDSSIKWSEKQNPVCFELVFGTIYNYWKNQSPNFLRRKKSRKNLLEGVRPNADHAIQLAEKDFVFKFSTESNSVKPLGKVVGQLTPEYSVADISHQPSSNKIGNHSLESFQPIAPATTFLEESDHQFSDCIVSRSIEEEQLVSHFSVSRSIEQEQLVSDIVVSRSIKQGQIVSDLPASRSIEQEHIVTDLPVSSRGIEQEQIASNLPVSRSIVQEQIVSDFPVSRSIEQEPIVSRSSEQEQIISSSNLLSPDPHSSKHPCLTPDLKADEIDASENFPTDICSKSDTKTISVKNVRKVFKKKKVIKSLGQLRSRKSVSKAVRLRKKCNKVRFKKNSALKKKAMLPPTTEKSFPQTKNLLVGSSKPSSITKSGKIENFQITLKASAKDGVSRMVSHASEAKPPELKNTTNVPEAEFQKIVLFLRSKVLLKCKDLPPEQQQRKANHLATLFIRSNVASALDRKTMKLLNEFADGSI